MTPRSTARPATHWNPDVAGAVAARLHPPAAALAVDTEDALKARARPYRSLALTDRSGYRAAAPYLQALRWTHDAQRLLQGGRWAPRAGAGVCAVDVLSRAFDELVRRPSCVASPLDTPGLREWRAELLATRLFDLPGTRAIRAVLKACLPSPDPQDAGAGAGGMVDRPALATAAWTVAWRRRYATTGMVLVLQDIALGQGRAPARPRALLLVEDAVLNRFLRPSSRVTGIRNELAALVADEPELAPQLAHLDTALRFLDADASSADTIDPLIDHLLADDTPWRASDILLLVHLSHLVVPGDDDGDSPRPVGGHERHVEKLVAFSLAAAAQGMLLSDEQARRVQDAAVRLLKRLASLVPPGRPAHGDAVRALLLPEVLEKALARLTPDERGPS